MRLHHQNNLSECKTRKVDEKIEKEIQEIQEMQRVEDE